MIRNNPDNAQVWPAGAYDVHNFLCTLSTALIHYCTRGTSSEYHMTSGSSIGFLNQLTTLKLHFISFLFMLIFT